VRILSPPACCAQCVDTASASQAVCTVSAGTARLSPQQEAILWLALRNHRRYGCRLLAPAEPLPHSWLYNLGSTARAPALYLWEIMVRVYGLKLDCLAWHSAQRLLFEHRAEGCNQTEQRQRRFYTMHGPRLHCFRFRVSCEHKIYADAARQRVASASMSRAVRALERHGLVLADGRVVHLTPMGAEIASALDHPILLMNLQRASPLTTSAQVLMKGGRPPIVNASSDQLMKSQRETSLTPEPAP
jgi:hypothetical protein